MSRTIKKADADGVFWKQDPSANLDYTINWSTLVAEASTTVVSSVWSISPSTANLHTKSYTTTKMITWVSGIVDGTTYTLAGKMWGNNGMMDRRIFRIVGSQGGQ